MRFVCHPTQGATCLLPAHWLISGGSGRIMAVSTQQNVSAAGIDVDWLTRKIDYRNYQECVHCGLCTASCPTYVETATRTTARGGRIYLMRAVADGRLEMGPGVRRHLELCLDCRACESACPSGVRYGRMIEPFKIALQKRRPAEREDQPARANDPPSPVSLCRSRQAALAPARLLQKLGVLDWAERVGLTRLLPPTLRRMQAMLPDARSGSGPATGGPAADRPEAGPGRPCFWAAWPTRCFPRPTRRPPGCFSRTAARS